MLVAGGTETQSGSSTKAFLIWLDALAYGVSFPLPDLVHPRPHSPSAAVDGLYGHIMGGTGTAHFTQNIFYSKFGENSFSQMKLWTLKYWTMLTVAGSYQPEQSWTLQEQTSQRLLGRALVPKNADIVDYDFILSKRKGK